MSRKRDSITRDHSADQSYSSDYSDPDKTMVEKMIKFLRPSTGTYYALLILLLFILYFASQVFLYFARPPVNYIFLLLILAEIACCIFKIIRKRLQFNSYIKGISDNGELRQAVEDYCRAGSFFDDQLRPGYKYIFVSGSGKIFAYDKIAEIYEVMHYNPRRSKELPEFWCLNARSTEGGDSELFIIRTRRTDDAVRNQLSPALNWIKKKAPHIKTTKGVTIS